MAADATRAAELPAGRELDALVAGRVMGWTQVAAQPYPAKHRVTIEGIPPRTVRSVKIPHYSTDVAAAWQVTDALAGEWSFGLWRATPLSSAVRGYVACFRRDVTFVPDYRTLDSDDRNFYDWAPEAPAAICRAALRAVGNAGEVPADSAITSPINSGEAEE